MWSFALVYFIGATGLGFAAGGIAGWIEDRGLLANQARLRPTPEGCGGEPVFGAGVAKPPPSCGGAAARIEPSTRPGRLAARLRLPALGTELWRTGRRLLAYFLGFSAIAYLALELIPTDALTGFLDGSTVWSVPLAALLGIPVYITSEGSLPMVAALMSGGLGAGPAMAFLITGAGTSVPAITGALVIARYRVVALDVTLLLVGSILLGWLAAAALP